MHIIFTPSQSQKIIKSNHRKSGTVCSCKGELFSVKHNMMQYVKHNVMPLRQTQSPHTYLWEGQGTLDGEPHVSTGL